MYNVQHVTDGAPSYYILRTCFSEEAKQKAPIFLPEYTQKCSVSCAFCKEFSTSSFLFTSFSGDKAGILICMCLQPLLDCRTKGMVLQKITVE